MLGRKLTKLPKVAKGHSNKAYTKHTRHPPKTASDGCAETLLYLDFKKFKNTL